MRQSRADKGSQKWIQDLINACPELINTRIQEKVASLHGREICWCSPLWHDDFAEYRDAAFLKVLHLQEVSEELKKFWPRNGPRWDALGKTADEKAFILVEAKANVPELISTCGAKSDKSLETISAGLAETQRWLKCQKPLIDWQSGFYQYANRLAHLYFLRGKARKEAYLVFLYFVADSTHIPASQDAWDAALELQKKLMGLSTESLAGKIINVFLDIGEVKTIDQRGTISGLPPET
jgi:hypothetical protein